MYPCAYCRIYCTLLILLCVAFLSAQSDVEPYFVPFTVNNQALKYPLAGGMNAPQLSEVDLNNDGIKDLYIFDRAGETHLTFLNEGTPNQVAYQYEPSFASAFPKVKNWVLLRDYDKDGIEDLFAHSTVNGIDGISVFKGYYSNGEIAFTPYSYPNNQELEILFFPLSNGTKTQIFVSKIDYPAIEDVDSDGDLDILTFNVAGGYLEYYQNQSIEKGYRTDSLIFELKDPCWGRFYESGFTPAIDLAPTPSDCFNNSQTVEPRHSGSTVTVLHLNDDCAMEVLLGDLSFDNLIGLHNAGDCNRAWMNTQDIDFPNYNMPAKVSIFPAAFHLDMNNDGHKDLIVSPNEGLNSENYNSLWFYTNTQTDSEPIFNFQQKDLIINQMIDLGSNSHPTFTDYNADGLMDMIVGSGGYYKGIGTRDARLFLFKNVGTPTLPAFELIDDDYLNFSQFNGQSWNFSPTFGDLDGDGDLDMLVGEEFGTIFYAENTGGVNGNFRFNTIQTNFMSIDPGQVSIPYLLDVNQDGLIDLLVGERNGNINYYQNLGTPTAPRFEADSKIAPNTELFGRIDAREPGFVIGSSAPTVLVQNGKRIILVGTENGLLESYQIDEKNYSSTFEAIDLPTTNLSNLGAKTHPALADINNDGKLEMLVGNLRGGLNLFGTPFSSRDVVNSTSPTTTALVRVYPNPSTGRIFIDAAQHHANYLLKLIDPLGRLVFQETIQAQSELTLPSYLTKGWYILVLVSDKGLSYQEKLLLSKS